VVKLHCKNVLYNIGPGIKCFGKHSILAKLDCSTKVAFQEPLSEGHYFKALIFSTDAPAR